MAIDENGYYLIEGRFFAPQSSISEPARLVISGEDFYIEKNKQRSDVSGRVSSLKVEPALGKTARKIYCPDGYLFESLLVCS